MPTTRFTLAVPALLAVLSWPVATAALRAQAPGTPDQLLAQAAPPVVPTTPPPGVPAVPPAAEQPTPGPLEPAPIAPPGSVIDGAPRVTPGAPGAPGTVPTDAGSVNAAGPRAREFQGDDVGQVLRLLARQAKINVVVSDQVQGTVSMRLEDVTALRAIEIICQSKGLFLNNVDGIYYIKTLTERAAEPTQADFYTFSYARASQVNALLTSQLASKVPPQIDERTNTVFYQETKSNLDRIRAFLKQVDRPTRQVMIEARLVEITNNPRQSYGINWAGTVGSSASAKTFQYGAGSSFPTAQTLVPSQTVLNPGTATQSVIPNYGPNGAPLLVPSGQPQTLTQNFTSGIPILNDFVRSGSLPNFGNALGGQLSILTIPQFSATLRLLNEDADAEFLANPRIVTADNLEATIKIVRNPPVPQLNCNEQPATAVFGGFQDKIFGNTLTVKPSINKDDFITLSVKPEISNKTGDQVFNFAGAQVSSPIIDTRTLEANVLIKSGCTLAVGGLLQDETQKITTKVPVLGDIPILGYLFQEKLNARTKRNLLIFVTPTIISSTYGTGLEDQVVGLKNSSFNEYADINGWRNNAKGAIRLVKTPQDQVASQYPVPGNPDCRPDTGKKVVKFRE